MRQPRKSLVLRTKSRSPVRGSNAACDSKRGLEIRDGAQRVTLSEATTAEDAATTLRTSSPTISRRKMLMSRSVASHWLVVTRAVQPERWPPVVGVAEFHGRGFSANECLSGDVRSRDRFLVDEA